MGRGFLATQPTPHPEAGGVLMPWKLLKKYSGLIAQPFLFVETMEIKKLNYSMNPWRLIADDGREVYVPEVVTVPSPGKFGSTERKPTIVNGPVCGKTKTECIQKSLDLLSKLINLHVTNTKNA